jgi:short-subunit dehydrogenase
MDYQGKHIWIIGASSGIGFALAKELAERGARLTLSARRHDQLENLVASIGKNCSAYPLDATVDNSMKLAAEQIKPDSVIYLAADYMPMSLLDLDDDRVAKILQINLQGAFDLVKAVSPCILSGELKQIALCGSVAGYCGLPNGQPYSATKAAIINLAQSLKCEAPDTLDVKLISPGFVRTPMTDKNQFSMPMRIEPETAAKEIADGLLSKKFEIHFPKKFTWIMKILSILPYCVYFPLAKKLKP